MLFRSMLQARKAPKSSANTESSAVVVMIQKTELSKRIQKKLTREVNLAEATMTYIPEYLDWSEQNVTFSRADHPPSVPRPGHAALVVEAQIGEFNMSKVVMDGGSGLNLLFANTLNAMNINTGALAVSDTAFHEIGRAHV